MAQSMSSSTTCIEQNELEIYYHAPFNFGPVILVNGKWTSQTFTIAHGSWIGLIKVKVRFRTLLSFMSNAKRLHSS
jgi:hypothetical protein